MDSCTDPERPGVHAPGWRAFLDTNSGRSGDGSVTGGGCDFHRPDLWRSSPELPGARSEQVGRSPGVLCRAGARCGSRARDRGLGQRRGASRGSWLRSRRCRRVGGGARVRRPGAGPRERRWLGRDRRTPRPVRRELLGLSGESSGSRFRDGLPVRCRPRGGGHAQAPPARPRRRPRPGRSRRGPCRRAGWRGWGRRCGWRGP